MKLSPQRHGASNTFNHQDNSELLSTIYSVRCETPRNTTPQSVTVEIEDVLPLLLKNEAMRIHSFRQIDAMAVDSQAAPIHLPRERSSVFEHSFGFACGEITAGASKIRALAHRRIAVDVVAPSQK